MPTSPEPPKARIRERLTKRAEKAEAELDRLRTVTGMANEAGARILDERNALIDIVADLVDQEECSYDHHGHCQAHGWLYDTPCPHKRAKELDLGGDPE